MIAFRVIQFSVVILIAWVILSQVVWPMLKGTRLFPLFSRRSKLASDLIDLRDEKEIIELERQVESERKNVERVKNIHVVDKEEKKA